MFLVFCTSAQNGKDQDTTHTPFGKGLFNKVAEDSTWYTKIAFRFQTQYEGIQFEEQDGNTSVYEDRFRVRRARIKGDGWATKSRRLKYKFEYDVHNGFVLDAVIKWVFDKNRNWELWFGQTKLPGNMERVISSQKLQFVDRSLLNSRFTLDRDAGVQLHGKQLIGEKFYIKEKFAFSQGEGLNQTVRSSGYGYTARLELFPFGNFKDAYVSSDLKRHADPKLMLAVTYDYNQDALRDRGQMGSYLISALPLRDLETIFADLHLKWRGVSWMVEYANKTTAMGSPMVVTQIEDDGGIITISDTYYTGSAINTTLGYLLPSNWELAGRYTRVDPEEATGIADQTQYGIALSRYIVGHNLKVQADANLLQVTDAPDQTMFRLQTEFNF
ncbi:MAG: FmdC precursor [Flavobacteriales bacterium]|nr:FmdC precursor [Flavobacteriales bacterium]